MSDTATEIAAIGEGLANEAAPESTEAPPEQPEQSEAAPEQTATEQAEANPLETLAAARDKAIEIFEQGADAEGFEQAAELLDQMGLLEPIDAEDEADDDEPISFDPDDYDDPRDAEIAELKHNQQKLEDRLNAEDEAKRTAAEEAQRQEALKMFAADMKEATGEDIDVENPDKWTPEQNILGSLGLQLGSVAEAKKMLAERDGQIKKEAIAKYIDGKSDVVLPPETSRIATENKSPSNQTARAELADVGRRIIHGQQ